MSERFLHYLEKEHARLEAAITEQLARLRPDDLEVARLKKAKLAVRDQIAAWQAEHSRSEVA
ncbi:YdcH family protein [Rhizorhabdus dicambivorans]|uniref:DUF465 domain-containing protein n=1 Tax=Rhizorhabdus dicambivorans TaxID=1850238 RepID=A0A2A4FYR7_9SPHN|nr:YdcH family protein [Rhizorhabdus dicambivorans]ATE63173.1 DUF465 domain-containing protein [Rhizorhabdus dicambivorans]PCE43350.1 DUF465 domain-containing protein [Rhizorhabdus dicambivorans]